MKEKTKKQKIRYITAVPGQATQITMAYSPLQAVTQTIFGKFGKAETAVNVDRLKREKGKLEQFALEFPATVSSEDDIRELEVNLTYLLANRDEVDIISNNRINYLKMAKRVLKKHDYPFVYR